MKKVFFIHPNIRNVNDLIDYLKINDKKLISELEWDENNPSYLFVSEHIYLSNKYFKKYRKYENNESIIRIYVAGECIAPDLNIFDYAIVFDRRMSDMDRVSRMPPNLFHRKSIIYEKNNLSENDMKALIAKHNRFCCFIYSNPTAHQFRDKLFFAISEYKKVDSLGKHLNNMGNEQTRTSKSWRELSIEMKSNYKFSIASENASYEGYTSEKLLTSFQAHTVPIYWGNAYVSDEYNEKAFINCNKYSSLDQLLDKIREIDLNDKLWCEMIMQPWQTEEQVKKMEEEIINYYNFINNIFFQELCKAKRTPSGTYPDRYREWFLKNKFFLDIKYSRIMRLIKKII